MKKSRLIFTTLLAVNILSTNLLNASVIPKRLEENKVMDLVQRASMIIQRHGKDKALKKFKRSSMPIFAITYNGLILASPIYPETIGTNQLNPTNTSSIFVRQEINKAKSGGGWLKGRYRKNHLTNNFECRRLYILPMKENYFIGSWYYYLPKKQGKCPV